MQDQFVGDIGDFGKYGLLRWLCVFPKPSLKLGVVWYRVPNAPNTTAGKKINYLCPECPKDGKCNDGECNNKMQVRNCDPELWDTLRQIVTSGRRYVVSIREKQVLGPSTQTCYFENPLFPVSWPEYRRLPITTRSETRLNWSDQAVKAIAPCEIVFLDPDNGIEVKSSTKTNSNGPKYIFWDELEDFWQNGKRTLVLYQTFRMTKGQTAEDLLKSCAQLMKDQLGVGTDIFALRWYGRWLIVIPRNQEHYDLLFDRAMRFAQKTNWGRPVGLYNENGQRIS